MATWIMPFSMSSNVVTLPPFLNLIASKSIKTRERRKCSMLCATLIVPEARMRPLLGPPKPLSAPNPHRLPSTVARDDEHLLVAAAKRGDTHAFEELVNRYEAKIFRLTMNITRNREDAEDAMQDAFLKSYRSEEHTSELQSPDHLVCRLLLEKKNELPAHATTLATTRFLRTDLTSTTFCARLSSAGHLRTETTRVAVLHTLPVPETSVDCAPL